ncbi:Cof-type HAD-IIB family hydrolase [Priestia megaterium]|uniref:Cof-type HAD-IIB family hydrolase n=1 Tax=Priestia megaterium TaxID=1404 RepID=UPI00203D6867|nr:Cof-type HAD-IIB family hydrolase [Priestia megaterium]MCM3545417.1 Cof-type HAD-IIB family hydrolase [Priestia megaterium]
MSYKIIFFDVDGTLTHHENRTISNETREIVKTLKDKGIKVVAATGRPLSLCEEIKELGIDTFITANGAFTVHNEEIIHKLSMDKHAAREVFEYAASHNHGLSFYTKELSMNGIKDDNILKALKETLSLSDYPQINERIYDEDIYLMCLYSDDKTAEQYKQRFPQLMFKRWHPFVVSVLQEEITKSVAIVKVLNYFNIHQSEAIAFGDGNNDIDMIEFVGLGIAMGNGSDKLKRAADFVTKKSSEDGIEFALKKFKVL